MTLSEHFMQRQSSGRLLFIFAMLFFACYFFFNLILTLFLAIATGVHDLNALQGVIENPTNTNVLKYAQLILSIGVFIVPPILFAFLTTKKPFEFLKFDHVPRPNLVVFAVLIVFMAAPLIYYFLNLNQHISFPDSLKGIENWMRNMEEQNNKIIDRLLVMKGFKDYLVNMLVIAIIPALGEELVFRGSLQQLLQRWLGNPHWAIILSGAIFSFIHFQFFGFVPRMLLGVLFGYLFYWSGNLWIPIIAHFIHNGTQVTLLYLFDKGVVHTDINNVQTFPVIMTIVTSIVFIFLLYTFYKSSHRKKPA